MKMFLSEMTAREILTMVAGWNTPIVDVTLGSFPEPETCCGKDGDLLEVIVIRSTPKSCRKVRCKTFHLGQENCKTILSGFNFIEGDIIVINSGLTPEFTQAWRVQAPGDTTDLVPALNVEDTVLPNSIVTDSIVDESQKSVSCDVITEKKESAMSSSVRQRTVEATTPLTVHNGIVILNPQSQGGKTNLPVNLSLLTGTVRDQSALFAYCNIKGVKFYTEVPALKTLTVFERTIDGRSVPYHAFYMGDDWGTFLNNACRWKDGTKISGIEEALGHAAATTFKKLYAKRETKTPTLYYAWSQMSNLPDGVMGVDVSVAGRFLRECLSYCAENGTAEDKEDAEKISAHIKQISYRKMATWLNGFALDARRDPDSSPCANDPLEIRVVDAGCAAIGVNQPTAQSRGGDHDFDAATWWLRQGGDTIARFLSHISKQMHRNSFTPLHRPYKCSVVQSSLTLQHVGCLSHFDDADSGYNLLVAASDKTLIGQFKTSLFWAMGGLFRAFVTREELVTLAQGVLKDTKNVDDINRASILKSYNLFVAQMGNDRRFSELADRVWRAALFPMEEAVMDAGKTVIDPDSLTTVRETEFNVKDALHNILRKGVLDVEQLQGIGVNTDVLRVAMGNAFLETTNRQGQIYVKYDPMEVLRSVNPKFFSVIKKKKFWSEGDIDTLTALFRAEPEELEDAFLEMGECKTPLVPFTIPDGTWSGSSDDNHTFNTDGYPRAGFESFPGLPLPEKMPLWLEQKIVNGIPGLYACTNVPQKTMAPDQDDVYRVLVSIATVTDKTYGTVINTNGSKRFHGKLAYAVNLSPEYRALQTTQLDHSDAGMYPAGHRLNVAVVDFQTKAALILNHAATEFRSINLKYAVSKLRQYILALPLIENEHHAKFLGEFIKLDFAEGVTTTTVVNDKKITIDWSASVQRHLWRVLDVCGFDLRSTSHATKGREVAVIRPNGLTVLTDRDFGYLCNPTRVSKMFSASHSYLPFTDGFHSIKACVLAIDSDLFGPGTPSDETYRTEDGNALLATSNLPLKAVTEEEYHAFLAENPEYRTKCRIQERYIGFGSFHTLDYYVPDVSSRINDAMYKLLMNYLPGISQPLTKHNVKGNLPSRIAVGFRPGLTQLCNEPGLDQTFVVAIVANEKTLLKKGANETIAQMAHSHLSQPVTFTEFNRDAIVCRERAVMAFRHAQGVKLAQKGKPVDFDTSLPKPGELNDGIATIEQELFFEGKRTDGRMYVYEIRDDNSLSPYIVAGEHFMALAGYVDVMRPKYVVELFGSYGNIKSGEEGDSAVISMTGRVPNSIGLNFTPEERQVGRMVRKNLAAYTALLNEEHPVSY